jgi:peptidoglycan/LPS O-acetylase OafA/YrhL
LSGFLITSILLGDQGKPHYYGNFYWKRVLRILPVYTLGLLVFLALHPDAKVFALLCVFFISNFASILGVVPHGPFWTLAIEEQFYLVWPVLVHRRSLEQIKRWSTGVVILCIAARFAFAAVGHSNYYLTLLSCDGLAAGAWIACWRKQTSDAEDTVAKARFYACLAFLAGVASIALSHLPRLTTAFAVGFESTGADTVLAALFVLILVYRGSTALAPLRSPVVTFLGLISYAFYMLHLFALELYDRTIGLPAVNDYGAYVMRLTSVFAGTAILSLLSRYLVERPAMSLRKYVLQPERSEGALGFGVLRAPERTASPNPSVNNGRGATQRDSQI